MSQKIIRNLTKEELRREYRDVYNFIEERIGYRCYLLNCVDHFKDLIEKGEAYVREGDEPYDC